MTSSYLRLSKSILSELSKLGQVKAISGKAAEFTAWRADLARTQLRDHLGVEWEGQKLLEIGCGQKLAYTLAFAQNNSVVGIDTELPLSPPYLRSLAGLVRHSGYYRAAKTSVAQALGQLRHFKKSLSDVTDYRGAYEVELRRMDAANLDFPDNHFNGAFSFSVFEHIPKPLAALQEVKRVLKPGGAFYLDLNLFTCMHGDHDPRPQVGESAPPPWKHLRPSCESYRVAPCYLNKVRLPQWRLMLGEVFGDFDFLVLKDEIERNRQELTPKIRAELSDYEEDELLMTTTIAVMRKPEA